MNLQFIKYYLVLADTHNFTRAAEKMNVVQSTFSAGIKKLEEQLDCKLFYRDKRNVRLTPEGEKLKDMAKELMACWNKIELTYNHHESKNLSVGLLKNILMDAILPKFNKYKNQYPEYAIKIIDGSAEELKKQLIQEELDCVIAKEHDITDPAFFSSFLYEERLMLTVHKGHELASKQSIYLKQLDGLPFITRTACTLYNDVYTKLANEHIKINPVFATENDEVVKGLVTSGVGCTLMSKPNKVEDNLVFIPIRDAEFISNIVIYWHKDNQKKNLDCFLRL
ncbi:LysR family transcriptional regulator [Microscilla marina]|uniref:LysR substrate binding domain, putative n=1 Tax=Microscilla marina ATCC 23134 TaxID=313606 RepID=A1ZQK8_MICM2|nr:LysR family transcriptional regulator [Microscilla marina]EAY27380.1 LysR substrate binding domain, putative [Microscilla marina ATCC 23134]